MADSVNKSTVIVKSLNLIGLIFLLSFICISTEAQEIDEDLAKKLQAPMTERGLVKLKEWREDFELLVKEPSDEQVIKTAHYLSFLKNSGNFNELRPQADQLYEEIQRTLLEMPGHGEVFERQYRETRQAVMEEGLHYGYLQGVWMRFSGAFPHLRSPETMRVLGGMLEDLEGGTPETRFPAQPQHVYGPACAADWAVWTLNEMGIEHPPVIKDALFEHNKNFLLPEMRVKWKQWWDEVKAGKRTYRFKGSDVEYGYNGPVEAKAPRSARRMERMAENAEQDVEGGGGNWWWMGLAALVVGGAGYWIAGKRREAG